MVGCSHFGRSRLTLPIVHPNVLGLDPRETRTAHGPMLVAAMLPENCGGNAVHVSASDRHSCVVTDTGDLYTWGDCNVGALGHGDRNWQPVAKRVASLKKVIVGSKRHRVRFDYHILCSIHPSYLMPSHPPDLKFIA